MKIGIVGGGQLAQMMIQAGASLGVSFALLALESDESATAICSEVHRVRGFDREEVAAFVNACELVTFDHELVDPAILNSIPGAEGKVFPSARTLRMSANKARQREMLQAEGIPSPEFVVALDASRLREAVRRIGHPAVAKAAHGGYDGRGVFYLDGPADLESLLSRLPDSFELIVEPKLNLEAELAVLVARSRSGEVALYPVLRTVQLDSVCNEVWAPSEFEKRIEDTALDYGRRIAEAVGSVGILAIEMFLVNGEVLINELAPRPHNSGHLTIEGCAVSQFENHLRAVMDLPLGPTTLVAPAAAMVNLLGPSEPVDLVAGLSPLLRVSAARPHLYHKSYRRGRKLGHVTALADSVDAALEIARCAGAAALSVPRRGTSSRPSANRP
ncbi:MAG: 5-(carboxyamino)imidazole ribonucleotide synthase [Actinomycetota bacterium]|nr:5-(carboxyamino)imidazole ribonucleotide synthase [Actinomycetota bacterium]